MIECIYCGGMFDDFESERLPEGCTLIETVGVCDYCQEKHFISFDMEAVAYDN